MTKQTSMFGPAKADGAATLKYPDAPGYKKAGPSKEAANKMRGKAPSLRDQCEEALKQCAMTVDELAKELNASPFSVRPRVSELVKQGKVVDSGICRTNNSGATATVWRAK